MSLSTKLDAYSDSYIINYDNGDRSLERRRIIHKEDLDDKFHVVRELETLTQLANRYYGEPLYWFIIADVNDIINPLEIEAGMELIIPDLKKYEIR